MDDPVEMYKSAARYLVGKVKITPLVGIVCGSGLSGLSKAMTDTQVFSYDDIPGFPKLHVAGHVGELVFGMLSGVPAVCMRGRFHFYEGHPMNKVVLGVKVMRCLGVKSVIVTNAAGGLNPDWQIGDVMNITDHFALSLLTGNNPLMGPNDDALGPRFIPVSNAYGSQDVVVKAAAALNFDFVRKSGCYAMVSGPNYEAPTEARFLRSIGCDSVGMSTIPEVVVAHHCGMKPIGLSLITNKVLLPGEQGTHANHAEVLEVAENRATQMQALVKEIVSQLKDELETSEPLPKVDLTASKATKHAMKKVPTKAMKKAGSASKKTSVMKRAAKKPTKGKKSAVKK